MRQSKQFIWWLSLNFICLLSLAQIKPVVAKSQDISIPNEAKTTFMLMPELPKDNLGGAHLGYFNLKLKSGQKKTVRLKVFNPTSQPLTIYGQVKDATTSDNADVDYLGTNQVDQQLLKHPGSQFVKLPSKTKLEPNTMQWLTVQIQAPKKLFKGQKATALNLSTTQLTKATAIENHYVYAIGLILNGQRLGPKDYRHLKTTGIKTRFIKQHRAVISVKIANPDPAYLQNVTVKLDLKNQKWPLIRYQHQQVKGKIAPSSSFYEDIPLGGKRLVPGAYQMTVIVRHAGHQQTIHKYVQISKDQARYINRYNYEYLKYRNLLLVGLLLISGMLGGGLIWIWRRKQQSALYNKIS